MACLPARLHPPLPFDAGSGGARLRSGRVPSEKD